MSISNVLSFTVVAILLSSPAIADIVEIETVAIVDLREDADMSAVHNHGDLFLIGVDEAIGKRKKRRNSLQMLARKPDRIEFMHEIRLCRLDDDENCIKSHRAEMDIEAIAADESTIFVVGSHAVARQKVDKKSNSKKLNRAIMSAHGLRDITGFPDSGWNKATPRERLIRLEIDHDGNASAAQEISLAPLLDNLATLNPFRRLPSKENGVDIEGMAFKDGHLFIGLRGPVLNGGYAIAVRFDFEAVANGTNVISDRDLRYVDLGGLGIRSMTSVSDGFLIIAGPVGNAPGPYRLYYWDGKDTTPGAGVSAGITISLGDIATSNGAKPEGFFVAEETADGYRIGLVEDSADPPQLRYFQADKSP